MKNNTYTPIKTLKEIRITRNISQNEISVLLGVTNVTISRWESGKSEPRSIAKKKIENLVNDFNNNRVSIAPRTRKDLYGANTDDKEGRISILSDDPKQERKEFGIANINAGDFEIDSAIEFLSKCKHGEDLFSHYLIVSIKFKCTRSHAKKIYAALKDLSP